MFSDDPFSFLPAVFIAWAGFGIIAARLSFEDRRWLLALIAPLAALIFWRGMPQGEEANEALNDALVIAFGVGVTLICALTGALLRYCLSKIPVSAVALLFAMICGGYWAWQQDWKQPIDMTCATKGVRVEIAGQQMFVPLEIGARLVVSRLNAFDEILFYSKDIGRELDVERVCSLSDHGVHPVTVNAIQFGVHNSPTRLGNSCSLSNNPFCEGFPSVMFGLVTDVKILSEPDGELKRAKWRFQTPAEGKDSRKLPLSISTRRDGTASFCTKDADEVLISRCIAWRAMPNGPTLVARAYKSAEFPEAAIVAHEVLDIALDWLAAKLDAVAE